MALSPPGEEGKRAARHYHPDAEAGAAAKTPPQTQPLKKALRNRHMQMLAIGGAIGAGLFVGSGSALAKGGPASLIICYLVIGIMILFMCQALAELAVLYPVNGAFFTYIVRFLDPSWGFAIGWEYTFAWLSVLPFELIAASITIDFWRQDIHMGVWVTVFLVVLAATQLFGVRGYGEVEFALSIIKILACVAFIVIGIVINCGAVGKQGYLGAKYWQDPGAFRGGFHGFAKVFTVAAFSFGGTELVGLAAAESDNPRKAIPSASRQVFLRITFFYIVNLLIIGLIVRSDDPRLLSASGSNTKASPFVIAIQDAGIKVLPHIYNGVITIAVISVANACTYGSSRTMQALAAQGMAPSFLAYIDPKGRPLWCVLIQLAVGLLAYVGEVGKTATLMTFEWLLALTGLSFFFVWGSICLAHIRFRYAWKAQGFTLDQIPYKPTCGVYGSWIGLLICVMSLMATFYTNLFPEEGKGPNVESFFKAYLAAPIIFLLYLGWKIRTGNWRLYIPVHEIDLKTGLTDLTLH
ncbi:amino acid permease/ SLC12A domain-containing protein [Lasiosphaeria ovina]|uniref:Amino acid permease/ SLC12A domain-containing protein n=1 Tax=Lasiosphaeria ovina TaxID=92902 RepID=A0AAE0ND05_9PEZI|nr:amino acid permease/ SLC12A domain-containing protein [Lasiosphaeria ovina]